MAVLYNYLNTVHYCHHLLYYRRHEPFCVNQLKIIFSFVSSLYRGWGGGGREGGGADGIALIRHFCEMFKSSLFHTTHPPPSLSPIQLQMLNKLGYFTYKNMHQQLSLREGNMR
jgi:hypothetical protein